jgi:hypothetical protein
MYARITQFEIDTLRISLDDALKRFQELILNELRRQPGYEGVFVMRTPEGKGMLMSLWATEETARAGLESGYYDEQIAKFVMFTKQPPGRDHYQVVFAEEIGEPAKAG